jgi:hypothetical protein
MEEISLLDHMPDSLQCSLMDTGNNSIENEKVKDSLESEEGNGSV